MVTIVKLRPSTRIRVGCDVALDDPNTTRINKAVKLVDIHEYRPVHRFIWRIIRYKNIILLKLITNIQQDKC